MSKEDSILKKKEVLRLNNKESNKLTRECIEEALIILMRDKDFALITISEICKKAGVSRTAYYGNYKSKEDILNENLKQTCEKIYSKMNEKDFYKDSYQYWLTMFESLLPLKEDLALLFKAHFRENIEKQIFQLSMNDYTVLAPNANYIERFWSGALCSILQEWIETPNTTTPSELAKICASIIQ